MRRRLTVVLVLLVAAALVAAGAGTLLVSRRSARDDASRQLLTEAREFARASDRVRTPRAFKTVVILLRLDRANILIVTSTGTIATPLPGGLTAGELSARDLLAGADVTGWRGNLAFAAVPTGLDPVVTSLAPTGSRLALLFTRRVGTLGPSWIYFLLVAGLTLVVAAVVAAALSRRVTRPLVEASSVTGRIASGELSARVETRASDYPELLSLADSINSMAEGLARARDHERQLLLSVSHDLRTPLTSIQGYAEAIEEGVATDVHGAARVIVSESRRLERLVSDLLDLARLETNHLSLHIIPTDVEAVVGSTVAAFLPRAAAAGINLSTTPSGIRRESDRWLVAADPDRLAQVIANLVDNSLAFARSSVTVSVTGPPSPFKASGFPPADPRLAAGIAVVVEDDGAGIRPAHLERVFDRFYQADRGGPRRGAGIGLAIVAELVRAMGGRVDAESPVSDAGGTRMIVQLASAGDWAPGRAPD